MESNPVVSRCKRICEKNARETLCVIQAGYYKSKDQKSKTEISLPNTTLYLEENIIKHLKLRIKDPYVPLTNRFVRQYAVPGTYNTNITVVNDSSLVAAHKLRESYPNDRICVLNFASAKNPGGGFLNGAQAQEESLARTSTLYSSLSDAKCFYDINEAAKSRVYTHNIIYSENVTVFRDSSAEENLLKTPYIVDIVSCPAVNRRLTKSSIKDTIVDDVMIERTRMIFSVTKKHDVGHLVLGAWGCGVFGNSPQFVCNMFLDELKEDFKGTFKSVVFAVIGDENYKCFQETLGQPSRFLKEESDQESDDELYVENVE